MNYNKIDLTSAQWSVMDALKKSKRRFYLLRWARRSGKNFLAMVMMIEAAINKVGTRSLFVGKNAKSARLTAFEVVEKMLRDQWGTSHYKANKSTLEITLGNGSVMAFGSSESPDAFRGQEVDGIMILDEVDFWGSMKGSSNFDEMFESVLRPLTSRTMTKIVITSTPKGVGMPLHRWWLRGEADLERFHLSHVNAYDAEMVPEEELNDAKKDMSPNAFEEEYMAEFMSASARVYPHFGDGNVVAGIDDRGAELLVGLDHNVAQSTAIIGQLDGKNNLEIIDEIVLTNSNTREMAISIKARYPDRHITVYPDPSGKSRKTSAEIGVTDHSILREEGLLVQAPNASPLIVDRINTVNNMVYTASGHRRLFVDSKCATLIESMNFHQYDERNGQPMKGNTDHYDDTNDSLGYLIWSEFGNELSGNEPLQVIRTPRFYG